ncbi:MAG: flagellar filament capping protein FliD [Sulfuritalea sp.]|nr:flagellar filament capping protein FliD [Sulfuritalea sp.]
MAAISSAGSSLDIESIVSKLMALERQPLNRLATREADYNSKLSAYGSIKGALSSLQTAGTSLTGSFATNAASVSDTTVLTASASGTAAAGSYSLSVTQLAKSHTVRSDTNYAATTDTFNTGSLAISINSGAAINVTIDSGNNTLAGIRQAINDASAGVTATIINDGTTNRLVLSSNTSGSIGAVSVAVTDDGSGGAHALSGLDSANLVQTQPADDANVTINGIAITRSSNTITDAIEGVTLKLTKGTLTSPGTATLSVARDTAGTISAVEDFVKAYNDSVGLLKANSNYDAATKTGAVLSGDSTVRSLQSQLSGLARTGVTGVAGGISYLSDIGITMQADGTLATDSTQLAAALADPNKNVAALFSQTTVGNEGIAVRFNTALEAIVGFGGTITARTDGIGLSIADIGKSRDLLNGRLTQIETRYRRQFAALDALVSRLNQTSGFLTQALANLPGTSNK